MSDDGVFFKEAEALHNLRVLEEIEKNPKVSQRELSSRLDVALGITNSLLKTLVRKGLIKVSGENNRSLTYHLTHAGVIAKSRLAMEWTLNTMKFYHQAKSNIVNKFSSLVEHGVKSAVLYGNGELVEIAIIVASETGLRITGIIDSFVSPSARPKELQYLGFPNLDFERLKKEPPEALIICTELDEETLEGIKEVLGGHTSIHYLM
jgi:DNA-binding MarR family transcriptional regulator